MNVMECYRRLKRERIAATRRTDNSLWLMPRTAYLDQTAGDSPDFDASDDLVNWRGRQRIVRVCSVRPSSAGPLRMD